mmetsp:Transcript_11153/g.10815  ORF Transcript_11153/g.10815 Transcript_11153/m.10815 type:complete len:136 (+) Transcript_11153:965-1372(+)
MSTMSKSMVGNNGRRESNPDYFYHLMMKRIKSFNVALYDRSMILSEYHPSLISTGRAPVVVEAEAAGRVVVVVAKQILWVETVSLFRSCQSLRIERRCASCRMRKTCDGYPIVVVEIKVKMMSIWKRVFFIGIRQ